MANIFGLEKNSSEVLIVEKSKFLSFAFAVSNENEIENILSDLRRKYYDATHICYAYDLLDNKQKCCDDGEPQGTAGKPILDCIQKQNLKNVLVVIVRYFGGIKLGAGGLLRAYSNGASLSITSGGKKEIVLCNKTVIVLQPNEVNKLKQITKQKYIKSCNIKFENDITATIIYDKQFKKELFDYLGIILNRKFEIIKQTEIYF